MKTLKAINKYVLNNQLRIYLKKRNKIYTKDINNDNEWPTLEITK